MRLLIAPDRPAADVAHDLTDSDLALLYAAPRVPWLRANLVSTVKRGREKLHYLNPVPIHQIGERWIRKFERGKLQALGDLKRKLESSDE